MSLAQGTAKKVVIKRQATKGTLAGATLGQYLRRESCTFNLEREKYSTESEITSKQKVGKPRLGVKIVNGSLSGINTPGTYSDIVSSVLRKDFALVASITGASITVAGAGPTYTIARTTGSYLTDGAKIGMVTRLTAGAFNIANLNKNLLIVGVTALVLTVAVPSGVAALVAEGPIATATVAFPGKVCYTPDAGHTNIYYTVEEFYSDVPYSERNLDVKFNKFDVKVPGTGNSTVSFSAIGLDQTNDPAAYFTAPSAETTSDALVSATGLIFLNGIPQAIVTSIDFSADGKGAGADGVVGTNIRPDVFRGNFMVTGSLTAYFDSGVIPAYFSSETAISIVVLLTSGSAANADFQTFTMPNVVLTSSTPDDNQTGLKRTYNFEAGDNPTGGAALANYAAPLMIHDSLAA